MASLPTPTSNEGIATVRTGWFTLVTLYLITAINEVLPDDLDLGTWVVPVVVTAVLTFFYRLSLYLSDNFKWWGVVLFLLNRAPGYTPPPGGGGDPAPEEVPAPNDAGVINWQTVFFVVATIAAIVFIIWMVDIDIG